MKKFLLSTVVILPMLVVFSFGFIKQVEARRVSSTETREQPWTCGSVKVWSPNDYKWSKPEDKSWYHIQSCIMEDKDGNVISKTTAFHSSGTVYSHPCFIRTQALNYNPWNYRDYGWWDVEGNLKPMNCGGSETTRVVVSPSQHQFVIGHEYYSRGWMKGRGEYSTIFSNFTDIAYLFYK